MHHRTTAGNVDRWCRFFRSMSALTTTTTTKKLFVPFETITQTDPFQEVAKKKKTVKPAGASVSDFGQRKEREENK